MIDKRNQTVKSFFTECHGLMIFFPGDTINKLRSIDRILLNTSIQKIYTFPKLYFEFARIKNVFFKEKRKKGKEKNESNEKRSVIDFVDSDKYIEH